MSESARKLNVLKSLNGALHRVLADERVVYMGEDILDPYGGAFKISRGLSTAFPDRVITTPISEQGFVGIAAGMAMRGLRPVVEIMFGDFLTLAMDQLVNHITKYQWMYNEQVTVPLTIRTPMGGGRGYGPTHSQSLEKHFFGMAGLSVVAPSPYHDPGTLLEHSVLGTDEPTLFVENKLMYARRLKTIDSSGRADWLHTQVTNSEYPTVTLSYQPIAQDSPADVTLVTYGGMAEMTVAAAETALMLNETVCEVVIPSQLQPLDLEPILASVRRTGRLVVCEEGTQTGGWGAEVIGQVTQAAFDALTTAPARVASREFPIANSPTLEKNTLPNEVVIIEAIRKIVESPASTRDASIKETVRKIA